MTAGRSRVLGAAVVLALGGCAPAPAPEPTVAPASPSTSTAARPTVEPSAPATSSSPSPATSPSATPSPTPSTAESPTRTAEPPSAPPPAPTAPAPSTAGGLGPQDVATAEGWHPVARPGSAEEGFMGNGTWVHATSPEHSAYAAIALGCTELGAYPQPVAALEGNLADAAGHPGVGLTLEFGTPADAEAYFAEWVRQTEACVGTVTQKVAVSDDTWLGRRHLGTIWSEAVGVRGDTVRLLIVESPDADLDGVLGAR